MKMKIEIKDNMQSPVSIEYFGKCFDEHTLKITHNSKTLVIPLSPANTLRLSHLLKTAVDYRENKL